MSDANRGRSLRRRRSLWLIVGAFAAVAGLLIGVGVVSSRAEAAWGHRGWGHHGDGKLDPERAKEHAAYAVGFVLGRIDASDEQELQIQSIVNDSIDEMMKGAAEHRARRAELRELFVQPDIDRDALEAIRKLELQLADELSRGIVSAIADVAEVLTLEQRAELIEMHHGFRRWH